MNKLLAIQTELKAPKNQTNNFGGYQYRSAEDILEALKPLLKAHGVTLYLDDEMVMEGNRVYVKATATLIDGDLVTKAHGWAREEETKKGMDSSQITGAASSYARKYALNGLFLIDDAKDSDATNQHEDKPAKSEAPKPAYKPEHKSDDAVKGRTSGKVAERREGTYGFVTYKVNGFEVSTKKEELKEVMDKAHDTGVEVQVDYTETVKGKYTNRYIDRVEVIPAVPF